MERNHLCNFGRGYYEEQFCVIILNLGQSIVVQEEMSFKRFFIWIIVVPVGWRGPFMQFRKRASWGTFM